MKKNLMLFAFTTILITSLFSDSADIPNGTVLEDKAIDGHTILRRKHEQELTIDYSAQEFQMIVYDSPFGKKIIDTIKKKDKIRINEICIIDSNAIWLKIRYKNITGYILYEQSTEIPVTDFYKDGLWQPVDVIKTESTTWHTLKCNARFIVYTNLNIREKPGLTGIKVGMITATQSKYAIVKAIEVTREEEVIDGKKERWAKIQYDKITGWVFAGYLEYERGGPRFNTPESRFEMNLGQGA